MHFSTLFFLRNEELENTNILEIEEIFSKRFCYNCGETKPKYLYWCDWFAIGGRWGDLLNASKGKRCASTWSNDYKKDQEGRYAICNVSDLTQPIDENLIYAIATKSKIYRKSGEWQDEAICDKAKFDKLLSDINGKKVKGVIAIIDCHD